MNSSIAALATVARTGSYNDLINKPSLQGLIYGNNNYIRIPLSTGITWTIQYGYLEVSQATVTLPISYTSLYSVAGLISTKHYYYITDWNLSSFTFDVVGTDSARVWWLTIGV